jgi:hypothetical protein
MRDLYRGILGDAHRLVGDEGRQLFAQAQLGKLVPNEQGVLLFAVARLVSCSRSPTMSRASTRRGEGNLDTDRDQGEADAVARDDPHDRRRGDDRGVDQRHAAPGAPANVRSSLKAAGQGRCRTTRGRALPVLTLRDRAGFRSPTSVKASHRRCRPSAARSRWRWSKLGWLVRRQHVFFFTSEADATGSSRAPATPLQKGSPAKTASTRGLLKKQNVFNAIAGPVAGPIGGARIVRDNDLDRRRAGTDSRPPRRPLDGTLQTHPDCRTL